MFPSISTQRLTHKNNINCVQSTNRNLIRSTQLNKQNHINQILNNQNYLFYRNKQTVQPKNDKFETISTQQPQGGRYYGRSSKSQTDKLYQHIAHEDLFKKHTESRELKKILLQENHKYRKQIQRKSLKSLQKGQVFRKYFNDLHGYLSTNSNNYINVTEELNRKNEQKKNGFVDLNINIMQNESLMKSLQRSNQARRQKQLLLQDLKKQMQHKEQMKQVQRVVRVNYNNSINLKDIKGITNNIIDNPQITNIFARRYQKINDPLVFIQRYQKEI